MTPVFLSQCNQIDVRQIRTLQTNGFIDGKIELAIKFSYNKIFYYLVL